jgi:putative addiction module killer protein
VLQIIDYYVTSNNRSPFLEWMNQLDLRAQIVVDRFIQRVAQGGAKKSIKSLKNGLFEIKIPHGPGLRVYFGEDNNRLILLLIGGTKRTQSRDIQKAKEYWNEYGKQKYKL